MPYDKISRAWRWLKGRLSLLRGKDDPLPGDYVMDRPRRKQRTFYFGKHRNWSKWSMATVLGVILIISAVKLISYGVDYYNAQQASASLREIYHAEEEATAEPTGIPALTTPPTAAPHGFTGSSAHGDAANTAATRPLPRQLLCQCEQPFSEGSSAEQRHHRLADH